MSFKLNISGVAGAGKTSLLASLGADTFVISRDSKKFGLPIPHMLVDTYYDMDTLLYGGEIQDEEGNTVAIDGVMDKIEAYHAKFGKYPKNIVWDSVSQISMDIIDVASQKPDSWGSQGKEVTAELAKLTKFLHEELELNGFNIITLNHVTEEKSEGTPTGKLIAFDQGKFAAKGGFYATVNEAITVAVEGNHRVVYTRDIKKLARTTLADTPDKMYVEDLVHPDKSKKLKPGEEYFTLAKYIDMIEANQQDVEEFKL